MPNRRLGHHWGGADKAKKSALEFANVMTRQAMFHPERVQWPQTVGLVLTFCPPTKRQPDLDNLLAACKHYLDGVALAMGIDDKRFRPITLDFGGVEKGGAVRIEVVA